MRPSSKLFSIHLTHRLPVVVTCLFIFRQSSFPGLVDEPFFPHSDKLIHFLVYAFLAMLCARDLTAEKPAWSKIRIGMAAVAFASVFGISDEIHQAFVPERCASVADALADFAGSLLGSFAYLSYRTPKNTLPKTISGDQP